MTKAQFMEHYVGGHFGDKLNIKNRLTALAELAWNTLKWKGSATAANIAASNPMNGDVYKVTTGGNLNSGDDIVAAATNDLVVYNGETGLWSLLYDVS